MLVIQKKLFNDICNLAKIPSQLLVLQQLRSIVLLKPVKTTPSDYYSGGRVSVEDFGVERLPG